MPLPIKRTIDCGFFPEQAVRKRTAAIGKNTAARFI